MWCDLQGGHRGQVDSHPRGRQKSPGTGPTKAIHQKASQTGPQPPRSGRSGQSEIVIATDFLSIPCMVTYMAVEVRMWTLDRFAEIKVLAYSGLTSLRLSMYQVLKRGSLLQQRSRNSARYTVCVSFATVWMLMRQRKCRPATSLK